MKRALGSQWLETSFGRTAAVSETMLHELYAAEGSELPTLAHETRFAAEAVAAQPPVTGARCR